MRCSATQLESFRLFVEQDWMSEDDLRATIRGAFVPNHKVNLGQAFGRVLEQPEPYVVPGGYALTVNGEAFTFEADVMAPALALMDRRGVYEAKATQAYGDVIVATRADQIIGARLLEHKTTLSSFDFEKYADSLQWRFMADIFLPAVVTYHVFCLSEATNGVIALRDIHSFNLFPYAALHQECAAWVARFTEYVTTAGLTDVLRRRAEAA